MADFAERGQQKGSPHHGGGQVGGTQLPSYWTTENWESRTRTSVPPCRPLGSGSLSDFQIADYGVQPTVVDGGRSAQLKIRSMMTPI